MHAIVLSNLLKLKHSYVAIQLATTVRWKTNAIYLERVIIPNVNLHMHYIVYVLCSLIGMEDLMKVDIS